MIIQALAKEIYYWIDSHAGRAPNQMRVPKVILEVMEKEAIDFGLHRRDDMGGDFKVAGVKVVADEGMTIGVVDV
jgi:hypothetical protein